MKLRLIYIFLFVFSCSMNAQSLQVDSLPNYPFLNFKQNQLLVPDSTTLDHFYTKLWRFESTKKGKVKILHIGDSHIQGGFWTEATRQCFHESFGCGTQERGFVFPFNVAQSNCPSNYHIAYTGLWKGCRSAFPEQKASWGLSGFNAYTTDDSISFNITADNFDNEQYSFDVFKAFLEFDTASYQLTVEPINGTVESISYDSLSFCYQFKLSELNDSISVLLMRKNVVQLKKWQKVSPKDTLLVHGFSLENSLPGVTYSEAGVNGGKVVSVLSSEHFIPQLGQVLPDLLVLSLGTNDAYSLLYNDSLFPLQYDSLLFALRLNYPSMEIILTTPGDANRFQKKHIKENEVVRQNILQLAQKYNCAVWDWYEIMGGKGAVEEWRKYKLCQYDRVHLNQQGYQLQGKLFYNALIKAYEQTTVAHRKKKIIKNHGPNWEQFWNQFYRYLPDQPLLFSSPIFWVLFLAFLLLYLAIFNRTKMRSWYLLLFSLFFYYKTGGWYFSLLIFSTLLDFTAGGLLYRSKAKSGKVFWLVFSLFVNISLLVFFKYSYFLVDFTNTYFGTNFKVVNVFYVFSNEFFGSNFNVSEIILPVGISFYTFQTMSYAIDIYRDRIKPLHNVVDFGFYVSFFPQLVAGPIVRANEFIPQIHQKYALTKSQFVRAFVLIAGGLVKKLIISDYIAVNFVDKIFDAPLRYSGFENLLSVYAYALQIYCDFSAYSDIAIALALLLGFSLPDNFNAPYIAKNITDFWRRWHMSLSRWLKDYVYISLGGNRKGRIRTLANLMLTMLIGGLWHGASIRFLLWGGLHGIALVGHKVFMYFFPSLTNKKNYLLNAVSWSLTFHFVAYCWVFFRANDWVRYEQMIEQISNAVFDRTTNEWTKFAHYLEVIRGYKEVVLLLLIGFLVHFIPKQWKENVQQQLVRIPLLIYPVFVFGLCFLLFQFSDIELAPFIYFQF